MAPHSATTTALAAAVGLALTLQGCGPKHPPNNCSPDSENCMKTGCCLIKAHKCFKKQDGWASCSAACTSLDGCDQVLPGGIVNTTSTTTQAAGGASTLKWYVGSWTTGYWDCCKPSCSWPGKGDQPVPFNSCDGETDEVLADANLKSVCDAGGGTAAACSSNMPFVVNPSLSMGFAAVAGVSKQFGLHGDKNCGQCFELIFTDKQHVDNRGNIWGGSSPDIVGKRMIIQVSNFGTDVSGNHTFDILIPGAGQGIFAGGCKTQFPGFKKDDFDCGTRHGGCDTIEGCDKLPKKLQDGCKWRFNWYKWNNQGQSNNPYIKYRRVKCPEQIVKISGVSLNDDDLYPEVNQDDGSATVVS